MRNYLFTILVLLLVVAAVPVSADAASLERTQGLYNDLKDEYNTLRTELGSTCDAATFALLQEQAIDGYFEARALYDASRNKAEIDTDLATQWNNLANKFLILSQNLKRLDSLEISCTEEPEVPVDTDGDRVADDVDNCPLVANKDQADSNSNGIGDACEAIPEVPVDTDGDRVADDVDNCPLVANKDQADADGDGVGDVCELVTIEEYETFLAEVTGAYDDFIKIVADAQAALETTCSDEEILNIRLELAGTSFFTGLFSAALEEGSTQLETLGEVDLAAEFSTQATRYAVLTGAIIELLEYENPACGETPEDPETPVDSDGDGFADEVDNCPDVANNDQADSDADGIGDVCEVIPPTLQERFNELERQYNQFDDQFDDDEDDYNDAVDKDDEDDIEDAEDELKELKSDLRDLRNLLRTLKNEVELNEPENNVLLDDIDDLIDDINSLREDISDVLSGDRSNNNSNNNFDYFSDFAPSSTAPRTSTPTGNVVLEPLQLPAGFNSVQNTASNEWSNIMTFAWIAGGMVILLAIILFLLAILLK